MQRIYLELHRNNVRMPTRSSDLERSHELLNRVYDPGRFTRDGDVQGEGATRTRGDPVREVCVLTWPPEVGNLLK